MVRRPATCPRPSSRTSVRVGIVVVGLLLATIHVVAQGQSTYYVAVDGSDEAVGSRAQPFATLGKALTGIAAGDTVYVREGTYQSSETIRVDVSGTDTARINLFAYPGETPVFDFTGADRYGLDIRGSYVHVKGLAFEKAGSNGLFIKGGTGNVIEAVTTRFNMNSGLQIEDGASNNLVINTDSYGNYDPGDHGEDADGFAVKFEVGSGNVLKYCRAWDNSDDGFDFWEANEGVTVEGSWSFRNGINIWGDNNFQGDSNGFKLGHGAGAHRLVRNLAWGHLKHGFDVNGNTTGVTLFNNTAFSNNDRNFYFDEDNPAHVLRNNVSLSGEVLMFEAVDDSSNSWNGLNIGGADFVSLNDSGADGPRGANGSLPEIDFLHPAVGGKLVDGGIDVGISYEGSAPDLGAFEAAGSGTARESEIPVSQELVVTNYPNPFSGSTTFTAFIESAEQVELDIFDVRGRRVAAVRRGILGPGSVAIHWDAAGLPSGIYRARLHAGGQISTVPVVVVASY